VFAIIREGFLYPFQGEEFGCSILLAITCRLRVIFGSGYGFGGKPEDQPFFGATIICGLRASMLAKSDLCAPSSGRSHREGESSFAHATGSAGLAITVRGSSRRIMIMRFRPANIRLINRRLNLTRLLLALSSKSNGNGNDKNNPTVRVR
jgi:hypothetical protein